MAKRSITSDVQLSAGGMELATLRDLARNEPKGFAPKVDEVINARRANGERELSLSSIRDIRALYNHLADVPVEVHYTDIGGNKRAITTSAFPVLCGGLIGAQIADAYEAVPTIGEQLVTDRDDAKPFSVVAAIGALDSQIDEVKEGKDFPEIGATETKYMIGSKRNGRRLSITGEMIDQNDVAGIVDRVNALGEIAGELVEEQTLDRVCDHAGSASSAAAPYVLNLNGTATALYSATANTPGTLAPNGTRVLNNALMDETDLEAVRAILAAMKNERGRHVAIPMSRVKLLVPDALISVASKLLNSELVPGVANELNNWGPRGQYRPGLVSSPKLDDISTSAWYMGDFQSQFRRKWSLRMEYVAMSGDTESYLRSRIAFQARIAWNVEIGAVSYNRVVQSLSGTAAATAP